MKKVLRILLVFLLTIVISSACIPVTQSPTDQPAITRSETSSETGLLFLGNKNIAPVIYLDGATPSGLAIDIVRELAKHIPQPCEIQVMDWTEAQALIAQGKADVLIQINPTEERRKIYDFSDPLLESHFSIFTSTEKMGITGISSLRGFRVGVEAGGLPQQLLGADPQINLVIIPNFLEGFRDLNANRVDAVVVDYRVGSYVIAENNLKNIRVTGEPIASSYSAFAVKKGNTQVLNEINNALQIIKADGTYQKIIDKWQPTEVVFLTNEQVADRITAVVIGILLTLILVAAIWMATLQKQLTQRRVAEEKLKEQYSTLHGIIENSNALIFSVDKHFRYTSFNKGHAAVMQSIYGVQIQLGTSLLDYLTVEEDREKAKKNLERALNGQRIVESAFSGEKDRSRLYFEISHSPILTEDGVVIGVAVFSRDMTEQKKDEDVIRQYAMIVEYSDDAIISKSLEGTILTWNKGAERIYGYSAEEAIGQSISILIPPECPNDEADILTRIVNGEHIDHFETLRMKKDGQRISVSLTVSPVKDVTGKVISASTIARDITERKLVDRELHLRDERFRMAQRIGHVGNWEYNIQTSEFWGSDEAKRLYGFNPGQSNFSVEEVERCIPERDRVHQALVDLLENGKPYDLEFEIIPRDSSKPKIISSIAELEKDKNGNPIKIIGVVQDITERKRAEEALRAASSYNRRLIEASIDPLVTIGPDGKITDTNASTEQATGYKRDDLIGTDFCDYFTDPEKAREGYQQVFSQGAVRDYPLAIRHRSGKVTEVLYNASVYRDDQGKVIGVFAAARDITERKSAEEEIRKLNKELEQRVTDRTAQLVAANKELEAFAYSVSHDLRAPLRHIGGFVELLQKGLGTSLDEQNLHFMQVISESANKMGTLIDDLLSFSRMGRSDLSKSQVSLDELVHDVIEEIKPDIEGRDIRWIISPLPMVIGDKAMLRIVWSNLISNAIKFTRREKTTQIEIGCEKKNETELVIFIRDNGVGFDMKFADKLFGVFQRLHRNDDFEGTGIGLANVQRIITRHGGKVWAESMVGAGATFYFSLPAVITKGTHEDA